MITALLFGSAASSALLIGAAIGTTWSPPKEVTGVLLAFASGALISALAFDLFEEAFALGGATRSGLGLLAGAAVFVFVDSALDRYVGRRNPKRRGVVADAARSGVGWALLAAVTLDGVPENLALGTSLIECTSVALTGRDLPLQPPRGARRGGRDAQRGRHARTAIWTWVACGLLLAAAVVAGRVLAEPLSDDVLSVVLGFAGRAVLASLADTVMPEAFDSGGPFVALATTAGFFISFILAA